MIEYAEALNLIAARYAERARTKTASVEKLAGPGDWLSAIGSNPALTKALLGGGIGAGLGFGSNVIGNWGKEQEEKKSPWSSMLTGGLAGAAAGGGLGLLQGSAGTGSTAAPAAGRERGLTKDPVTGQPIRIDPELVRQNPGIVEQLRAVESPATIETLGKPILSGAHWMRENLPGTFHGTLAAAGIHGLHTARPYGERDLASGLGAIGKDNRTFSSRKEMIDLLTSSPAARQGVLNRLAGRRGGVTFGHGGSPESMIRFTQAKGQALTGREGVDLLRSGRSLRGLSRPAKMLMYGAGPALDLGGLLFGATQSEAERNLAESQLLRGLTRGGGQ